MNVLRISDLIMLEVTIMSNNKSGKTALNDEILDGIAGGDGCGGVEVLSDKNDERYQKVLSHICPDCGGTLDFKGTVCYMCSCGSNFVLL